MTRGLTEGISPYDGAGISVLSVGVDPQIDPKRQTKYKA